MDLFRLSPQLRWVHIICTYFTETADPFQKCSCCKTLLLLAAIFLQELCFGSGSPNTLFLQFFLFWYLICFYNLSYLFHYLRKLNFPEDTKTREVLIKNSLDCLDNISLKINQYTTTWKTVIKYAGTNLSFN